MTKRSKVAGSTKASKKAPRVLKDQKRRLMRPKTWRKRSLSSNFLPLPKARIILKASLERLVVSKKAVAGITLVYGLGVVLLVRGFSVTQDFTTLRTLLDSLLTGSFGKIQSIALQLTLLFGGAGETNTPNGGIYQTILLIVCSLALIWVFRQAQAKKPVSTKRAFYLGMYPLIPFMAVLLILGIQLLPLTIGSYLYGTLTSNGITVTGWEKVLSLVGFLLLAFWSLRMITATVFALYIVTLSDMLPIQAVRAAKRLVHGRRLIIWRKLLLLPLVMLVVTTVLVLPFLVFLTGIVVWVFFVITVLWFSVTHSYLYSLYRELLREK